MVMQSLCSGHKSCTTGAAVKKKYVDEIGFRKFYELFIKTIFQR